MRSKSMFVAAPKPIETSRLFCDNQPLQPSRSGYSNRKLGDMAKAMTYYTKALNKEPKHLGANEYMGELYLELKNLPKAEERLGVLKNACGNCEEYQELAEKVDAYKAANGQS